MFLGGLARLDYLQVIATPVDVSLGECILVFQGTISAYFTVFTWSYLSVHTTKLENADRLYERHLGQPDSIFKVQCIDSNNSFPCAPTCSCHMISRSEILPFHRLHTAISPLMASGGRRVLPT